MTAEEFRVALNSHAQASADLAARMMLMAEAIRTGDGWKHPQVTAEDAQDGPGLLALLRRCQRADELLAGAVADLRAAVMQQATAAR